MDNEQENAPPIAILAFFASFMPAGLEWDICGDGEMLLPRESLMCVDRASYLKQVGMAAAMSQLQMWLGIIAVYVIWMVLACPTTAFGHGCIRVGVFGIVQPWFFGLRLASAVSLARSSSPGTIVFFPVLKARCSE